MDDLDVRIIEILQQDAKTPFKKIAKALNISTDTVRRRFKKLRASGTIGNPKIILDPRMCEFKAIIDFLIKTKPGADNEKVHAQLARLKNVGATANILGEYNLYCSVFLKDIENMMKIYEEVSMIEEIAEVETIIYAVPMVIVPLTFAPNFNPILLKPKINGK